MINDEFYVLNNGVKIPRIGFGTWQISLADAYESTMFALKAGYRHIDTALAYENETEIGRALKESGIKREDIFVTTKLPAQIKGYDETLEAFDISLKNLDLDYIDLYLIHAPWPWSNVGQDCTKENIECWKAMIKLYNEGKIRAIGVSNFRPENIKPLVEATGVIPQANQIRYFIGNTQKEVVDYCKENNILIEAYSPLATSKLLTDEGVINMAKKYNVTPAQLALRYCLDNNTLPLPKSTHEERIKANLDVNFNISKEDMAILDKFHNVELDKPLRS